MLSTGHVIATPRPRQQLWHQQYTNTPATGQGDTGSPNYPRTIGRLVAGLFQQQPVTMPIDGTNPAIKDGRLADLTDRGVKRGAAESVIFLRPTMVAGKWMPEILPCNKVDAEFEHEQLVSAVMWRFDHTDPDKIGRAITEHHAYDDQGRSTFDVQAWTVKKKNGGGWELGQNLVIETGSDDPFIASAAHTAENPRQLFAWAWDFEDGEPIAIHATNEHLITQLNDLQSVEHNDSEMPRNVVAVARETMAALNAGTPGYQIHDQTNGRGAFRPGRNMIEVPGNDLAQHGTAPFIQHIRLEDDLTQRDRIEAKENAFYEACGISPSTLGRQVSGRSQSGDAKRADSQLTLTTIAGPARRWAETLTDLAAEIARLDTNVQAGPVQVTEGLKTSADERVARVSTARNADVMSIRRGVQEINPDWEDSEIDDEVGRIREDNMIPTAADADLDDLGV